MKYDGFEIREIKKEETSVLSDFLYEAIFQQKGTSPLPKNIIKKPELSLYIENFGKKDDNCLVAVCGGKIVGAVWTRIIKGYGSINDTTPELAISLYKEYRKKGIGKMLMLEMIGLLKEKGYKQVSLSVQKESYAVKLYEKVGFEKVKETKEEYIMLKTLQ